jgi:hypothetical protein
VPDCRLDIRAIGVRSSAKMFFSSLCVQTSSEALPASCPMGTGVPFPGGKARPGRDADHSLHLVPRSRMSRSYNTSPPCGVHGGSGAAFIFYIWLCTSRHTYVLELYSNRRGMTEFLYTFSYFALLALLYEVTHNPETRPLHQTFSRFDLDRTRFTELVERTLFRLAN